MHNGGYPKIIRYSAEYRGSGSQYFYSYGKKSMQKVKEELGKNSITNEEYDANKYYWRFENNFFQFRKSGKDDKITVKRPSEYQVAETLFNTIGGQNVDDIVIYQESHHGYNNDSASVNLLGLNRKDIYTIATLGFNPNADNGTNYLFLIAYGHNVTLSNVPRDHQLYVAGNDGQGVVCIVPYEGKTTCMNY